MMLWFVVVGLPAALAHITNRRELQSCGSATFVAAPSYCSNYNSRNCYDDVPCGETCEGDGECGTDGWLNNCGNADVYERVCSPTPRPTPAPTTPAPTKQFPTCGVRINLGDGKGFACEDDSSATEHAGKKIAFACCEANTCSRKDADGQCLAGDLWGSNFAPKDWYEATNVCAAEGKVLCGVEQPCINRGCSYNRHYQWTGQECQAGDAGLPAACASA